MTIERFKGYQVPVGAFTLPAGYYGLPGGGYRGLTDELDAIVMTAAERLTATYKRDIQVRYNSDRLSGGAYLMPEAEVGVIGVGAGIHKIRPAGFETLTPDNINAWLDDYPRHSPQYRALPEEIEITTNVNVRALVDPTLADHGNPERAYSYVGHASLDAAFAWLAENMKVLA